MYRVRERGRGMNVHVMVYECMSKHTRSRYPTSTNVANTTGETSRSEICDKIHAVRIGRFGARPEQTLMIVVWSSPRQKGVPKLSDPGFLSCVDPDCSRRQVHSTLSIYFLTVGPPRQICSVAI